MRTSEYFLGTVKETPADAEIVSHQLMLRAGMIRKLAAGLYTWLPLGFRVLKKVEKIIREEMNRTGALEVFMPVVQPAELWQESGRWEKYGAELLRLKDRHQRDFCLGPTHEEVITDFARRELRSYKQLPVTFYQIQTKFRDEIRPRFGVMRAREFIMKDAYSFHENQDSLERTYMAMYNGYSKIFTRLGLAFRAVQADTGSIGGSASHEFQVLAASGEDLIVYSDSSDYAANIELATSLAPNSSRSAPSASMQMVDTPGSYTIEAVSEYLKMDPKNSVKTLLVVGKDTDIIALILRGDHELNAIKAEKMPQIASPLQFATLEKIRKIIKCDPGSIGPVGLPVPMIVDRDASVLSDFVCGANINDKHYINVNWERDIALPEVADLRKVTAGDLSPDGQGKLLMTRGIEVGHIFDLGDKYSKSLQLTVLDENGKAIIPTMGCYGIGVSRIVAAAIEQNHDDHGIIWPDTMAPFQIALIPMNLHKSERVKTMTEKLYQQLTDAGFDVLFDDRKERAGVLFADMDLIGIPHRIVIGERGIDAGVVEYKSRREQEVKEIQLQNIINFLQQTIKK